MVDDAETERVRLAWMYAVWIEERSNRAAGNGEGDWLGLWGKLDGCLNMQGEGERMRRVSRGAVVPGACSSGKGIILTQSAVSFH